jgi:hypothetical protein
MTLGIGVAAALISVLSVPAVFLFAQILNETTRLVRVRTTRLRHRELVDRLRGARAALFDSLVKVAEDLELPGRVLFDGRVEPDV